SSASLPRLVSNPRAPPPQRQRPNPSPASPLPSHPSTARAASPCLLHASLRPREPPAPPRLVAAAEALGVGGAARGGNGVATMSRPSFRPRPVDIHRRLPIVRFARDLEDDDPTFALRPAPPLLRHSAPEPAADGEARPAPNKKNAQEIPTPQYDAVDTYERDYTRTFAQPTTYIRGRGARAEIGDFIEYDLDNEDEDWLENYNNERTNLNPEMLEVLLFKLEILDHKARERAGIITPTMMGPIPVILQLDSALEGLQYLSVQYAVFQATYSYWKAKRERWQKPILRHLQPPPPTSDTNPYNVFRPREKAHRLHTRRMQRRENSAQSFERLRLVRRNLEQAKALVEALIKREVKKREAMECEVHLRRIQVKYKHEAELLDDGIALSGLQQVST
ncbi:unnamed protein product, partial [Urochloa humidicola]